MAGSLLDVALDCSLGDWNELDTRCDVVNVRCEMFWDMVSMFISKMLTIGKCDLLVGTDANFGGLLVLMLIEFSQEQRLCFLDSDIDSNPSSVLRVNDATTMNAEVSQPLLDVRDGFFFRSECVVDLFGGPMLAVVLGIRM
jgi:hypothetical protein